MAGNVTGGKQAAKTNIKRYGKDFYANIGRIGGAKSRGGGFATAIPCTCDLMPVGHLKRQCAGKRGGTISRRTTRTN